MKAKIIALVLLCLCTTSCFTMTVASLAAASAYALASIDTRLKGETVKQIEENAALLKTEEDEPVCIVYDFNGKYKDGKKINAKFRRGGTYEYKDDAGHTKLAPIYVSKKHMDELVNTAMALDSRYKQESQEPVYQI